MQVETGVVIGSNVLLCNSCHICAGANIGSHVVVVEHAVVDVDVVIPSTCIVTTKGFFENRNGQPGKRLGDARRDKPTPEGVDPNPADKGQTGTPFVWMRDNQAKKQ